MFSECYITGTRQSVSTFNKENKFVCRMCVNWHSANSAVTRSGNWHVTLALPIAPLHFRSPICNLISHPYERFIIACALTGVDLKFIVTCDFQLRLNQWSTITPWGRCYSSHAQGKKDNHTWLFHSGQTKHLLSHVPSLCLESQFV